MFELGRSVTVADVLSRAGVGRNTFYIHFRDVEDVLRAAEGEALSMLRTALTRAYDQRTPLEKLRRIAIEWVTLAEEEPHFLMLVLRGNGTPYGAHFRLQEMLVAALARVAAAASAAGALGRRVEPTRLRCLAGAFVASAEALIEREPPKDAIGVSDELVAVALRLLR